MTRSEIFHQAHAIATKIRYKFTSYRIAFSAALKSVYSGIKSKPLLAIVGTYNFKNEISFTAKLTANTTLENLAIVDNFVERSRSIEFTDEEIEKHSMLDCGADYFEKIKDTVISKYFFERYSQYKIVDIIID